MDLLLRELIKDEKKQDKQLYSSGKYWSRKNLKTINQIKKKKLKDFRGLNSGVGTSFTDNIVTNLENELNFFGRLAFRFFKLPFLNQLFLKQVDITLSHAIDLLKFQAILYKKSPIVENLINKYKFTNSVNNGCCQKFLLNNIEYSFLYLEIANRIENISKFFDFKSINSFFEIGGGFGANIDFIINNFSNIKKIIYLDTVPNIYVGTMYLKDKYNNSVIDYMQTKDKDVIEFSNNDKLEIICIAPWQIEKLNVKIDHFHNAASFVEMPNTAIVNYLKFIFKNNVKSISLVTYYIHDPKTTFDPYSLNDFFEKKLDVHEFSTAVPELGKKDIYFVKKDYDKN
mgnify:CR=1 FL=1